jgi:hypothetical protein
MSPSLKTQNSSTIKIMCLQGNACLIFSSMKSLYDNSMDTERDIEMAAIKLMMDTKLPQIEVLKMILGRYQSQRRLEEAVIVQRLIDKELSKPEKYGHGLYQDF